MKKSWKKRVLVGMAALTLIGGLSVAPVGVPAVAAEAAVKEESVAEPQADRLVWYVIEVDGVKYRRLYNASYEYWVTDWIRCP